MIFFFSKYLILDLKPFRINFQQYFFCGMPLSQFFKHAGFYICSFFHFYCFKYLWPSSEILSCSDPQLKPGLLFYSIHSSGLVKFDHEIIKISFLKNFLQPLLMIRPNSLKWHIRISIRKHHLTFLELTFLFFCN